MTTQVPLQDLGKVLVKIVSSFWRNIRGESTRLSSTCFFEAKILIFNNCLDATFFKIEIEKLERTSRERPKSAPYLKLKNSKRTSKCQVFSSTVPA